MNAGTEAHLYLSLLGLNGWWLVWNKFWPFQHQFMCVRSSISTFQRLCCRYWMVTRIVVNFWSVEVLTGIWLVGNSCQKEVLSHFVHFTLQITIDNVQYYRSYSHSKSPKNYTLAENCTKSHLHGSFIDAHISEITEDINLKFCTLPYECMMNTSCKFHEILRWSSWSHLLNGHGMTLQCLVLM